MRVLIAAVGSRGDVQPMLALAMALRRRGHEITFGAPPNFSDWVSAYGFTSFNLGRDFQAFLAEHGTNLVTAFAALKSDIRRQFEELEPYAANADVILGASVHCAGLSYAEKRGIPYAYVVFSPSLVPSDHHPAAACPWHGLPRWANRATWWINGRIWDLLFRRALSEERVNRGLPRVHDVWRHILGRRVIVAAEPAIAPPPTDARMEVIQTGAWFLPADGDLDPGLEAFLASGPPPVYVGFGSMSAGDPGKATQALVEAGRRCGVRLLLSQGWAGLGGGELPDGVRVIGAVPHDKLFPRLAAVVHHGGAGTTIAAAKAGVPQVLIPHVLDQFFWADRLHGLGLCPRPLPRWRLNASRLAGRIAAALEDRAKDRAEGLASRIVTDGAERGVALVEAIAANGV